MDTARKRVQEFKRSANPNEMGRVRFSMKLPENYELLPYHDRIKVENQALDNAIAEHLGVALSDKDSWPEEQGKILANEWASGLPDK